MNRSLQVQRLENREYDGSQLESLWIRKNGGGQGDALVYFEGPCHVTSLMIDLEDVEAGHHIHGDNMLHFLIEIFDQHPSMELAVTRQRLFAAIVFEVLTAQSQEATSLVREGDDIYLNSGCGHEGKMSVSIATITLQSTLIHFALNITSTGTPEYIETACLNDLGLTVGDIVYPITSAFQDELAGIADASAGKVGTK